MIRIGSTIYHDCSEVDPEDVATCQRHGTKVYVLECEGKRKRYYIGDSATIKVLANDLGRTKRIAPSQI
jgi:hypothetical protein